MSVTMTDSEIIDGLCRIVGQRNVMCDSDALAPWLTDWRGRVTGTTIGMISPKNREEVQAIVKLAAGSNIPIVPQGGNSGMVAGAVPKPGQRAILLSMRKMNAIRSIDAADNSMVAEAGAILSDIHLAAQGASRRFPLSLGAKDSATIGGLVSTNAGGTQVLRFGSMRNLILGVEVVLPDGSLFDGLSTLRKDNRGYDLRQLFAGAEGTLGVVTTAALKLYPAAPYRSVAWVGVTAPDGALELLRELEGVLGDAIEGFELVPAVALDLVLDHIPDTRRPIESRCPWHVLIEARSSSDSGKLRKTLESALALVLERGGAVDAVIAQSERQADDLWKLRETISEAERIDGMAAKHDVSVPVSRMPGFIKEATEAVEQKFDGTRVIAFGHLGDGNIHFNVRAPKGVDDQSWFEEEGSAVIAFVHDLVADAGGSLSAEHGIGQLKIDEFARLANAPRLATMRAIKQAIDPQGIMNPGKLVPLAKPAEKL